MSNFVQLPDPADEPMAWSVDRELVLPRRLRACAADFPARPFLVEVDGRTATFGEVYDQSICWAASLEAQGVRAGETVATMIPPSLEAHYVWIGASWLHALEVPLNNAYRGRILTHTLGQSSAALFVTTAALLPVVAEVAADLPALRKVVVIGDDHPPGIDGLEVIGLGAFLGAGSPGRTYEAPEPEDIATIIFTSGTTGPSKGVQVRWAQLLSGLGLSPSEWNTDDARLYVPYPVCHVSGKCPVIAMARSGGCVVIRPQFSVSSFWSDVRRHRCTSATMIGSIAPMLRKALYDTADNPLRYVTIAPGIPDVDDFKKRLAITRCLDAYGMTEIGWPLMNPDVSGANFRSCGRPRPGYSLRIVDAEDRDVELGVVGELLVRAENPNVLNAGYLNMPEETAKAYAGGWFHTGDAFRCDADGYYYFTDRMKDAIRRRGENISGFEVEAYVNDHPAVLESAAIGVPSEIGEDDVKVVVVLREGTVLPEQELFAWLAERMPRFMVPRYVEFVAELPKTDTGKVRKQILREASHNERTVERAH